MGEIIQSTLNQARTDKFRLVIDIPDALRDINTKNFGTSDKGEIITDSLQLSIKGTIVPSTKVNSETLKYAGQSMKVSLHTREPYENVTVQFPVDNRYYNYWLLQRWLSLLNDMKDSVYDADNVANVQKPTVGKIKRSATPPQQYQTTFTVYGIDEYNKNVVKFIYKDAFPVSVGAIEYTYDNDDSAELYSSFEFAFSQLYIELI
jgi:hypothetical protein